MPIMPAGETSVSFTIDIINDEIFELQEFFVLDLEDPSPEIVFPGSPNMARVNILDDDCKYLTNTGVYTYIHVHLLMKSNDCGAI